MWRDANMVLEIEATTKSLERNPTPDDARDFPWH
jgi:hypothetical protein